MLITSDKELRAIYPSSQIKSIGNLLSTFEDVERGLLINILGTSLYNKLLDDYHQLLDEHNGIWADRIDKPDDRVFIIRACQSVIVFHALDDNVGILSSSLNMIGGFNRAETENYEGLDKELRHDLKNDLYRRKLKSVESLLCLLEEDAHHNRIYTDLWKESSYYYYQSRLLIPSARSMHPFLMDLGKEPHSRFVSILPCIFKAQDLQIGNRIGQPLLDELLSAAELVSNRGTSDKTENEPNEEITTTENNVSEDEESETTTSDSSDVTNEENNISEEQNEEHSGEQGVIVPPSTDETEEPGPTDMDTPDEEPDAEQILAERAAVLHDTLPFFRRALAYFVMSDTAEDEHDKDSYRLSAEQYLNKAVRPLVMRSDIFREECITDLDEDFRKWHKGKSLGDLERIEQMKAEGKREPHCHINRSYGFVDLGGLYRK